MRVISRRKFPKRGNPLALQVIPVYAVDSQNHARDNPVLNQKEEVWTPYPPYPNRYEVSSLGRVRSIRTNHGKAQQRVLPQHVRSTTCHYLHVNLCVMDKNMNTAVHRMVALSFIPNPDNKPMVNHIDGNKLNNDACNLEWVTCSENHKHAYANDLRKSAKAQLGKKCGKGSQFHNVSWDSSRQKFLVAIKHNGTTLCRKRFNDEIAAAMYVNEQLDLHGLHDRPRNLL